MNKILVAILIVLFTVLVSEVVYLVYFGNRATLSPKTKLQNGLTPSPSITKKDRPSYTAERMNELYDLIKEGYIASASLSLAYRGTLQEIKNIDETVNETYPYRAKLLIFLTTLKGEETRLYFSESESPRLHFFQLENNETLSIKQNDLKKGDDLEIVLTDDMIKNPSDNLNNGTITKIN